MKYKYVIFDIDGTLVDNEKAVIATWQKTINQLLGKYYKVSELDFCFGHSRRNLNATAREENPQEASRYGVRFYGP